MGVYPLCSQATPGFAGGFALLQGEKTSCPVNLPFFITPPMCAPCKASPLPSLLIHLPLEISRASRSNPLKSPPLYIPNDILLHPMTIPTAGKSSPPTLPFPSLPIYLPLETSAPPAPTPLSPPPHISNDTLLHPMTIPTAGKSSPPTLPLSSPPARPTPWKNLSPPTAPTLLPHICHDIQLH